MRTIVGASMRFRLVVLAFAAGLLVIGVSQLRSAPVDVLPEFTPAYVEIQTEAPGLSADEVEQLITVPLEADLLNGVQGVDVIRSQSLPGLSSVVLVFEPGTDVYRGRQLVQERLTQLGGAAWPMISKPSVVLPPLSSSSRVLMIGLSSRELSPIEQSVIARWTVRPRLMGVSGVANVSIWGQRDQQLQVQVDPEQLRDRGVTLSDVVETAGNAQVFSPLSYLEASTPGAGGFIETPQQRLQVRNALETIADPATLGQVPVEGTNGRLTLADVSTITVDHQPLIGDAIVDDAAGLLLVVEKYPGADTLAVTRGVEQALDKLRPGLTGLSADASIFRPADIIDEAKHNLSLALLIGTLLMVLVGGAVLFQWRAVVVWLLTLPVALVAAAVVLDMLGETFNAISLAGLAVGLVVVIDDGIACAQAVSRRSADSRKRGSEASIAAAVADGSVAVRSPLVYATLIALLAVVPLAAMQGRPGEFYAPLVLAYTAAVVTSLLVAVVVAPALSLVLWSVGTPGRSTPPASAGLRARYDSALAAVVARPAAVMVAVGACVLVSVVGVRLFDTSLIPDFKDRHVIVQLQGEPGMSNPRMTEIATGVSRDLRALDGVSNVAAHIGRAVTGDQRVDVNSGEVWVSIADDADYDATLAAIRGSVADVDQVRHQVVTYTEQKIRDVGALEDGTNPASGDGLDVLTGSDRPLVIRVYGQDPDVLMQEAEKVAALMDNVSGVVNPRIQRPETQPTLEIAVDLARARRFGIKPGDVRRAETSLLQGILVGSVFEAQKVFDVVVQGTPESRANVAAVRNLLIDRPGGGQVRLGQVADVRIGKTPSSINRDAVSRRVDIIADVRGDLGSVSDEARDALQTMTFPLEYHAEVLQRTTNSEIGATRMLASAVAALIAAFLIMQAAFQSWRLALLAFVTVPAAMVGGVVVVLLGGAELSLGGLVGLLAVGVIAVRNILVLIRHLQDVERADGMRFGEPLVRRGARDRLQPTGASALSLLALAVPFVVLGDRAGLEVVGSMAGVLIGGLVSTTLITLFLLPALYLRFGAGTAGRPEDELMRQWGAVVLEPAAVTPAGNGGGTLVTGVGNGGQREDGSDAGATRV